MTSPGFGQPHKLRDFLDWLKATLSPELIVPIVLLGGYHVLWFLSRSAYDLVALGITTGVAIAAVLAIVAARGLGITAGAGIKAFLVMAGVAAVLFSVLLYLGAGRLDQGFTETAAVSALAVALLMIVAAAHLHQQEEMVQLVDAVRPLLGHKRIADLNR